MEVVCVQVSVHAALCLFNLAVVFYVYISLQVSMYFGSDGFPFLHACLRAPSVYVRMNWCIRVCVRAYVNVSGDADPCEALQRVCTTATSPALQPMRR